MISGNTVNYWLAKDGIDIKTIGFFSLISIPYSINFLWAPIFDLKKIPYLDQYLGLRVSWIFCIYVFASIITYLISLLSPTESIILFSICAFCIALLSSAADVILGALRTEMIDPSVQGSVSGIYIVGYRIGMLISGSGAIYASSYIPWSAVYKIFAMIIFIFALLITLVSQSWVKIRTTPLVHTPLKTNFIKQILMPIGSTSFIILVILFLVLYRLPDNMINTMINPFLLRLNYSAREIAIIGKFFGVIGAIIGGILSSYIMSFISINRALLIFGIIHSLGHSLFLLQEIYGNNQALLLLVIGFEAITGGMTMAAYIAFISSLCNGKFRATQYSFFSSMMGLSRSILTVFAGYVVAHFGWKSFFYFTTIISMPGVLMIFLLPRNNTKSHF